MRVPHDNARLVQIKDLNLPWVLLGHSERRTLFHETDELVAVKTVEALKVGVDVILCIGENLGEREGDKTTEVVTRQLAAVVQKIKAEDWK